MLYFTARDVAINLHHQDLVRIHLMVVQVQDMVLLEEVVDQLLEARSTDQYMNQYFQVPVADGVPLHKVVEEVAE